MSFLQISLLSLLLAQFLKIFNSYPPQLSRIIGSGGMPSSHASFVSCLSTLVGLEYGFASDLFSICAVFSLIVIYDAGGVRRAVGKQANILNQLIKTIELKNIEENKELIKSELKELIGHTRFEILAGVLLGIVIALLSFHY